MNDLSFIVHGDFGTTFDFLKKLQNKKIQEVLNKYGKLGVEALSSATPVKTGKTAASWTYKLEASFDHVSIIWDNTNRVKGYPIAFLIQYGHATGGGGYVQGRDYINPALRPVFDELAKEVGRLIYE